MKIVLVNLWVERRLPAVVKMRERPRWILLHSHDRIRLPDIYLLLIDLLIISHVFFF